MALKRNRTRWYDALSRVDSARFEALIADHYRREGWRVQHVGAQATGQRYDGGIDLKVYRDDAYLVVQCKHWNACQVPHNDVHELLGVMVNERATGAVVVSSGEFTAAAREAAAKHGHVQLIDGETLRATLDPVAVERAARVSVPRAVAEAPLVFRVRPKNTARMRLPRLVTATVGLVGALVLTFAIVHPVDISARLRPPAQTPMHATKSAQSTPVRESGQHVQQAAQPIDPASVARATQSHIDQIARDVRRSARIPDASRPIDHEAARAVVHPLAGIRSAVWLDESNFMVMVAGQDYRSMAVIDRVCDALEPLGDTLAVVVNVQDVNAKTHDEATTLSRNCQLPQGQRSLMQARRQMDVVAPQLQRSFKAQQRRS
jgi:hypothetical protein